MGLYFNLLIIALTGLLLLRLLPEPTPGLILEMLPFRSPILRVIPQKVWFRVKEFIVEAWSLLILGSLTLSILQSLGLELWLNLLLRPLTWSLGLPEASGVPLIFGVLRKELSLVMLGQALGSTQFDRLLSPLRMLTFTTFIMFYLPCLATLDTLKREPGTRRMLQVSILTVLIAWIIALEVYSMRPRDYATTRLRDHVTTRLRDYATTRPRDYVTTRLRDHVTTRLCDHATTRLRDYVTT